MSFIVYLPSDPHSKYISIAAAIPVLLYCHEFSLQMEHRLPLQSPSMAHYPELERDSGAGSLDTQAMSIGVSEGATSEDNPSQSHCVLERKWANDKNGNDGNERKHDGLSREQVKRMGSKKGTRDETERNKWNDVYAIAFPHDKPSSCLCDSDEVTAGMEIIVLEKYSRFLGREVPQLVTRELRTIGCPMSDTVRDEIQRHLEVLIHRLHACFLDKVLRTYLA
ncbi:hypothetical protein AU210_016349 [Fusarium oxysporum f. sp. radicis-cucumerinum]|uniref:Uncharacterized protein n=1 Tax=Fusarium oxysporum f. sp. radicis-cucumerinum TaxID=327505 RepID=A0A2H3G2N3_FUSOX|nr:hypothetical protein AU210_016349 [Fusarium oxysporum f. sp. radicis-cucumerinum]